MPRKKPYTQEEPPRRRFRRALTPEGRESQMIALAVDLAEKQLAEGTASAQVITHYLKLGTTQAQLEREILERQKDLIEAKTERYRSDKRMEELYAEALNAMRIYSGQTVSEEDDRL